MSATSSCAVSRAAGSRATTRRSTRRNRGRPFMRFPPAVAALVRVPMALMRSLTTSATGLACSPLGRQFLEHITQLLIELRRLLQHRVVAHVGDGDRVVVGVFLVD